MLNYWTAKSGRATTGLDKDGILKIVDETKRYWIVQWVEYPADEEGVTVETKDIVAQKYPQAIVKWRNSLSREQILADFGPRLKTFLHVTGIGLT